MDDECGKKNQVYYIEGSKMRPINLLMLMGAIFNIVHWNLHNLR